MALGRRRPPPVPPIKQILGRSKDPDLRRAGAKLEEFLKYSGRAQYLGLPPDHTHSSSGSGGTIPVTAYEQAELIGWMAWMKADEAGL